MEPAKPCGDTEGPHEAHEAKLLCDAAASHLRCGRPPQTVPQPTIFQRRPTCKECCLFPTPIVWALVFGGTNYDACPAIPHAAFFTLACSSVALLNEMVRFVFRLPLAPWDASRSRLLVWLCTALQASTAGLACWGAVLTFPQAGTRLAQGGGQGCNSPAFVTAFSCAALTLLTNAIVVCVLAHRWRTKRCRHATATTGDIGPSGPAPRQAPP